MNTSELETILRSAPKPTPPPGLASELKRLRTLPPPAGLGSNDAVSLRRSGGSRTGWWLAIFGCGLLASAATIAWQASEIRDLEAQLARPTTVVPPVAPPSLAVEPAPTEDPRAEIGRLEAEVARLRAQLAAATPATSASPSGAAGASGGATLSPEQLAMLDAAKARADSIRCINNLKQIGLGVRIYAVDHAGAFPPDFNAAQAGLAVPSVLTCPGDTERHAATDWTQFTSANLTYEYLAADGSESDPMRVMARCPVHGNVVLCDGSAQMNSPAKPLNLVNRNGRLYFE